MPVLILGLLVFLAPHGAQIVAPATRSGLIERIGIGPFRGLYSLVSLAGFALIIWGFGMARSDTIQLWAPGDWTRPVAIVLNLIAFVLLAAYLLPAGRIKATVGHPMMLATLVWSTAHLLANGSLADLVLFGGFFVWSAADLASLYARDRAGALVRTAGPPMNDLNALALGVIIWAAIAFVFHRWLFGVSPLG